MFWQLSNNESLRSENVRKDAYLLMSYLLGMMASPFSLENLYSSAVNDLILEKQRRGIMFSQKSRRYSV